MYIYPSIHTFMHKNTKTRWLRWSWLVLRVRASRQSGENRNNIPMPALLAAYAHTFILLYVKSQGSQTSLGKWTFSSWVCFFSIILTDFILSPFPIHPSALSSWADVTAVITTPLYTHFKTPFPLPRLAYFFSARLLHLTCPYVLFYFHF